MATRCSAVDVLRALGSERAMGDRIWCVDTVEEAYTLLAATAG